MLLGFLGPSLPAAFKPENNDGKMTHEKAPTVGGRGKLVAMS
jgi:hypothetical protein